MNLIEELELVASERRAKFIIELLWFGFNKNANQPNRIGLKILHWVVKLKSKSRFKPTLAALLNAIKRAREIIEEWSFVEHLRLIPELLKQLLIFIFHPSTSLLSIVWQRARQRLSHSSKKILSVHHPSPPLQHLSHPSQETVAIIADKRNKHKVSVKHVKNVTSKTLSILTWIDSTIGQIRNFQLTNLTVLQVPSSAYFYEGTIWRNVSLFSLHQGDEFRQFFLLDNLQSGFRLIIVRLIEIEFYLPNDAANLV